MTWPADGSQVSVPPPCPRTWYDPAYPSVAVTGVVAARSCRVTAAVVGGGACDPPPGEAAGEHAVATRATTPKAAQRPRAALVATRISVGGAPAAFADAVAQLDGGRAGGGLDQQVRAGVGRVADLRRIRVDAGDVEHGLPVAIGAGIGPVRYAVRAHAPGEVQHAGHDLRFLGLGGLAQRRAGGLGRPEAGIAEIGR